MSTKIVVASKPCGPEFKVGDRVILIFTSDLGTSETTQAFVTRPHNGDGRAVVQTQYDMTDDEFLSVHDRVEWVDDAWFSVI